MSGYRAMKAVLTDRAYSDPGMSVVLRSGRRTVVVPLQRRADFGAGSP